MQLVSTLETPLKYGFTPPDGGMRRAVINSLFNNARARDDDEVPQGYNRQGNWGDVVPPPGQSNWKTGSRLWLLWRAKQTPETARRAEEYAAEALDWLVKVGTATSVDVTASWVGDGWLALAIKITLADGTTYAETFRRRYQ